MTFTRKDELIFKALYLILLCVVTLHSGEDFKRMSDKLRLWKNEVKNEGLTL